MHLPINYPRNTVKQNLFDFLPPQAYRLALDASGSYTTGSGTILMPLLDSDILFQIQQRQNANPLVGKQKSGRYGGMTTAVTDNRRGNPAWGRRMLANQGGLAVKRHNPLHLKTLRKYHKPKVKDVPH